MRLRVGSSATSSGQRPGALDARGLLGGARGRAAPQPLGLAAERVAQDRLPLLLRGHRLRLALDVGRVVARHVEQAAGVAAVELEDPVRDPLQEQAIVRDGHGREARRRASRRSSQTMLSTSRWLVGSSSSSSSGRGRRARASATRFCQPPESSLHRRVGPDRGARQVELGQQLVDPRLGVGIVGVADGGRQPVAYGLAHRGPRRQLRRLGQPRDPQVAPAGDGAAIGRELAGQDLEQRRLAGAVGADEPHPVPIRQREPDPLEQRAHAIGVGQIERCQNDGHRVRVGGLSEATTRPPPGPAR